MNITARIVAGKPAIVVETPNNSAMYSAVSTMGKARRAAKRLNNGKALSGRVWRPMPLESLTGKGVV